MRRIKVLIVDDHRLMLDAITASLSHDQNIEVVGVVDAGEKVLPLVGQTAPDAVLLDVRMPGMDGLSVLERLREQYPSVAVVMFSGIDDPALVRGALERGAAAFVLKHVDPGDLGSALRQSVTGSIFRPIDLVNAAKTASDDAGLTKRELSILQELPAGGSNQQIAKRLFLAEQTVKFHLTNIYRKLGLPNRTAAARWAHEAGLLLGSAVSETADTTR
jgi:DNA-binding NarL/FixJ family response regulator